MHELNNVSILNILPPNLAADPQVIMEAKAFDQALQEIMLKIPGVSILPRLRELTDDLLLDLLAWQFHVDFYDQTAPIDVRREQVARSLDWHSRKGTPAAIEEVLKSYFGSGLVKEWFEYGGRPGYFKVEVKDVSTQSKQISDAYRAIQVTKRVSSHLEELLISADMRQRPASTMIVSSAVHAVIQVQM